MATIDLDGSSSSSRSPLDEPYSPFFPTTSGAPSPTNPFSTSTRPKRSGYPGSGGLPSFGIAPSDEPTPPYSPQPPAPPTAPAPPTPPAPPGPPTSTPYSFNAFRTAFDQITAGRSGTLQDFIGYVFPALQQQFPGIKRIGSKGDKILLPDGTIVDAVIGSSAGGRGYAFQVATGPGSFFSDPIGDYFASTIGDVIRQLQEPHQLAPQLTDSYSILRSMASRGGGGGAPDLSQFADVVRRRAAELNQEPFSATEEAAQRVRAFDNLERSRTIAIAQVRERLAAMGHAPTSGTVEAAIQQVNNRFDALRASNENELLINTIGERQRRRSEATSLEQALADRQLQATSIGEQSRSASESRSLSAAQALASLAQHIGNATDPAGRLGLILRAAGLIPDYVHQVMQDAKDTTTEGV